MMLSAMGLSPERIIEMAKELGLQQFLSELQATANRFEERLVVLSDQQNFQTQLLLQILEASDGQAPAAATNPELPVLDKLPPMNGEEHHV